jgi:hypothetical protein
MAEHPTDYCNTPDELAKNPDAKAWFKAAANGDKHAYDFLWRFWCFAHCYDDLLDQGKPVTMEMGVREFMNFFTMISYNPFYQKHKDQLYALITQVCTRWLDGDEWEQSDDKVKRICSKVVRCGDIDLYMHVAYLSGGWDHMRKLKELRVYDSNGVEQRELGITTTDEGE